MVRATPECAVETDTSVWDEDVQSTWSQQVDLLKQIPRLQQAKRQSYFTEEQQLIRRRSNRENSLLNMMDCLSWTVSFIVIKIQLIGSLSCHRNK